MAKKRENKRTSEQSDGGNKEKMSTEAAIKRKIKKK
jgi:hypothetical protein